MEELKVCPMTSDEAIGILERIAHTESKWPGTDDSLAALDMAVRALRRATPENESEIEKKLWALYDKYEDAEHAVCGDAAKLLQAATGNKKVEMSPKHKAAIEELLKMMDEDGDKSRAENSNGTAGNGSAPTSNSAQSTPLTIAIDFTEDEIIEFTHYLNSVKSDQLLDGNIRMSVLKLLHKFPDATHTYGPKRNTP